MTSQATLLLSSHYSSLTKFYSEPLQTSTPSLTLSVISVRSSLLPTKRPLLETCFVKEEGGGRQTVWVILNEDAPFEGDEATPSVVLARPGTRVQAFRPFLEVEGESIGVVGKVLLLNRFRIEE